MRNPQTLPSASASPSPHPSPQPSLDAEARKGGITYAPLSEGILLSLHHDRPPESNKEQVHGPGAAPFRS